MLNPKVLSYIVFGYMIVAFGWWAVNLWHQNEAVFELEKQLLMERFSPGNSGLDLVTWEQSVDYQSIEKRYHSRHKMIFWEGSFFVLLLISGLWFINRSAKRELAVARQQRNFLLSITHELKSPIAGIRLILETFSKRELPQEIRNQLTSNGLREADRLQNLVNDILFAARLEERWKPLHEPIDLEKMVAETVAGLRIRFPNAIFNVSIPENWPPVQADKSGLAAVLQNLLENAVKYSPEGKTVSFLAEKTPAGKLKMAVSDFGQGIPAAEKQKVFEKFYRLENEETRRTKGTGLGLFIVKQVALAHGGKVQVTDNQPNGSIFTVEI